MYHINSHNYQYVIHINVITLKFYIPYKKNLIGRDSSLVEFKSSFLYSQKSTYVRIKALEFITLGIRY